MKVACLKHGRKRETMFGRETFPLWSGGESEPRCWIWSSTLENGLGGALGLIGLLPSSGLAVFTSRQQWNPRTFLLCRHATDISFFSATSATSISNPPTICTLFSTLRSSFDSASAQVAFVLLAAASLALISSVTHLAHLSPFVRYKIFCYDFNHFNYL